MRPGGPGGGLDRPSIVDRAMTTRARRRLAVQTAAAVTSAVLLVGGAAWLLVGHEQRRDVDRQTAAAVDRADDVIDPPDDIYLFLQAPNGALTGTPGSPPGLPDLLELAATSATGQTRVTTIERAGRDFQIRTERRPNGLLQAAYDLTGKEQERHRLLAALGIAESIGVAAAALVGALLGQRAVAPLGEALTRQRRFVAEAAHELRTPLTLLHTRVQLLERAARRRGDDALAVEAREILDDSRRLGEVIEDLLLAADLARNADRRTVVDLSQLTRDVVAAAAAQAEQQAVRLTFRHDPTPVHGGSVQDGSPGVAPFPATVLGIESALRRAVTALVDNALGHTPSGGTVTVTVSHRTDRGTKMLTVRVSDTGIGLDPTHARRLFERFARGETTGDRRRFGLGLALVHETIANHQGRIEVDGALGRGASFTIILPATQPRDRGPSGPGPTAPTNTVAPTT